MRVKGERTSSKDKKSNLAKYFNTFFKAKLQIQEKKRKVNMKSSENITVKKCMIGKI